MKKKQKIELMVPESLLDEYLAKINVSSDFVARPFVREASKDWSSVDVLFIESVSYETIESFIKEIPQQVEVIAIDDEREQKYHKANLLREGVVFTKRGEFLSRFEAHKTEDISEDTEEDKEKPKRKSLKDTFSKFKKKDKDQEAKKPKMAELLSAKKPTVQKIEVRSTEKETVIPVIKIQEKTKKRDIKGAYMIYMSAFICALFASYLSKDTPVSLVDFTGKINKYFGCDDVGKIKMLLKGVVDPLIITDRLYYYGDSTSDVSIEEFLQIKETLLKESKIVVLFAPKLLAERLNPAVDKTFYVLKEEEIIKGEKVDFISHNPSKFKLVINKRLNILTRSDIKDQLTLEENIELMEIPQMDQKDLKSIYMSVSDEKAFKQSAIERYFNKFCEQL